MSRSSILCAGYMPLDLIAGPTGLLERRAGGTAGNVGVILSYLGWDTAVVGQTGDDIAGETLLADLKDAGVGVEQIRRVPGGGTPRLVHAIGPAGHSYAFSCPTCGSRFPRSRPLTIEMAESYLEAHARPDVFFFDRVNAGTLVLAEHLSEQGTLVMFEPSMPASAESLTRALAVADVVKYSQDSSHDDNDLLNPFRADQIQIVTRGSGGLQLGIGEEAAVEEPAIATNPCVDAGGAGDWTSAGFLYKVVRKGRLNMDQALVGIRFGQALAALNCTLPGARGLMRLRADTVRKRARSALRAGEVSAPPRVARVDSLVPPEGFCDTCLTPLVADSCSLSVRPRVLTGA